MRSRLVVALIIVLALVSLPLSQDFVPSADATPALAAPAVAIGTLTALDLAVAAAVTAGILTIAQGDGMAGEIDGMIASIKDAQDSAWNSLKGNVLALYNDIQAQLSGAAAKAARDRGCANCGALFERTAARAQPRDVAPADTRATPRVQEPACPSPQNCCKGGFMDKFKKIMSGNSRISNRAFRIWKSGPQKGRVDCCLEWDSEHRAWEVFKRNGDHLGERQCTDTNDDPCAITPGRAHNPGTHQPRFGCNQWQ